MNTNPGILLLEPDTVLAQSLQQQLSEHGYHVWHATSHNQAVDTLHAPDNRIGVVLVEQDANTQGSGVAFVRELHDDWPMIVPIVTSAFRKVESAVTAMRLGAADYLLKPIVKAELLDAVQRAMQRHLLMVEHETVQQDIQKPLENRSIDSPTDYHGQSLNEAMKAPEQRILLAALEANGWNRGQTAKQLDINRTTLYKKIRQYKLDEPA